MHVIKCKTTFNYFYYCFYVLYRQYTFYHPHLKLTLPTTIPLGKALTKTALNLQPHLYSLLLILEFTITHFPIHSLNSRKYPHG